MSFWRKPARRGLRPGEELLLEVDGEIVDSSGTSLPGPRTPVTVGLSAQRLLVWAIPKPPMRTGRFLGSVDRSRLESATAERRDERMTVLLDFQEGARLSIDAPAEFHPEQLVWALTAGPSHTEQ